MLDEELADNSAEESALVARLIGGEPSAIADLYVTHRRELLRFCRSLLHNNADAEDAVEETFLRALKAAPRLDPTESHLKSWLYVIARRVCVDVGRKRRRDAERIPEAPRPLDAPDELVLAWLDADAAIAAISQLSERDQELFALRSSFALSSDEIAARTGMGTQTVDRSIYRVRQRLRESLRTTFAPGVFVGLATIGRRVQLRLRSAIVLQSSRVGRVVTGGRNLSVSNTLKVAAPSLAIAVGGFAFATIGEHTSSPSTPVLPVAQRIEVSHLQTAASGVSKSASRALGHQSSSGRRSGKGGAGAASTSTAPLPAAAGSFGAIVDSSTVARASSRRPAGTTAAMPSSSSGPTTATDPSLSRVTAPLLTGSSGSVSMAGAVKTVTQSVAQLGSSVTDDASQLLSSTTSGLTTALGGATGPLGPVSSVVSGAVVTATGALGDVSSLLGATSGSAGSSTSAPAGPNGSEQASTDTSTTTTQPPSSTPTTTTLPL